MLSMAILPKPTFAVLLLRHLYPLSKKWAEIKSRAALILLALAAPLLWQLYLLHLFGGNSQNNGNLGWPFKGLADCLATNWLALWSTPFQLRLSDVSLWKWRFFELMAPVSLLIQAGYLITRRKPASPSGAWGQVSPFSLFASPASCWLKRSPAPAAPFP